MAKQKFTFKFHPKATGLSAVGNSRQSADIKLNKKVCGLIQAPNWTSKDNNYIARLTIKHNDPAIDYCDWKWITLTIKDPDINVVKNWLNEKIDIILERCTLHFSEE